MRHTKYINGGYGWRVIDIEGGAPNGRIWLFRDPVLQNEAATRRYLTSKLSNLNANAFTTGTLKNSSLPEFKGDILKPAGSNVVTLPTTGVTAGTYAKVQINSKGRVLAGKMLVDGDLPSLPFSKVSGGKPNTAGGYGISDNILTTPGGTFTGDLKLDYDLTGATQYTMLNKGQVEVALENISYSRIPIGGLIESLDSNTPAGYLRANGSVISKTTYAALYAVIGDRFNAGMVVGSGKPWRQQYLFNTTDPGNLTWSNANNDLPVPLMYSQAIVTKNRVYLLGGYNNPNAVSTVYTAPINEDGTLGTWTTGTSLPGPLSYSQAVVTKNRVYLLGEVNSITVYTAPINEDGTLGTWTTGTNLPGPLGASQAVVTKNRVYLLGRGNTSTVYTAPINEDGTLGTWTTGTSLPGALGYSQAVVTKNRVYLLGGTNSITVYTAPINEDGTLGTWTTGTSLPSNLVCSQAVVTKNRVYLLGGYNGSYVSTVYTAPINEDGTLGTWTTGTSLPGALGYSQAVVTKNRVYLLGGHSGSTSTSTVYTAPFTGGRNDYSEFYTGNLFNSDPTKFKLPNVSHSEDGDKYSYIRYE